jgi:hypothetical protein
MPHGIGHLRVAFFHGYWLRFAYIPYITAFIIFFNLKSHHACSARLIVCQFICAFWRQSKLPASEIRLLIPAQRIPSMFNQHLKEQQPTGAVSLRGPSGNRWQAALASESESEAAWCFDQGWKEFVTDHSLRLGHFLVFTRDGPAQFSVAVFSSSGVIDPAALDARPTANGGAAVKLEEGEGVGVRGDVDAGGDTSSEVSLLPAEEDDGGATGRRTGATSGGAGGACEMSLVLREEGRGVTGKRARATTSDLPADASAPKKHSALAKKAGKRRPQTATSKDVSMIVHSKRMIQEP